MIQILPYATKSTSFDEELKRKFSEKQQLFKETYSKAREFEEAMAKYRGNQADLDRIYDLGFQSYQLILSLVQLEESLITHNFSCNLRGYSYSEQMREQEQHLLALGQTRNTLNAIIDATLDGKPESLRFELCPNKD